MTIRVLVLKCLASIHSGINKTVKFKQNSGEIVFGLKTNSIRQIVLKNFASDYIVLA